MFPYFFPGIEFYFTIIPDIMTRWHVPQIWLLVWFSLLYFWSLSSCVCMLALNVNALLEAYTSLEPYRNVIIIICCTAIFIFDRITVNFRDVTLITGVLMVLMIMLFINITIIAYTLNRVATDYHFVQGIKLDSFWILVLKIALFINCVSRHVKEKFNSKQYTFFRYFVFGFWCISCLFSILPSTFV